MSPGAYVENMVKRVNVQTTSPIPDSPSTNVGPKNNDEPVATEQFRKAMGFLMWVSTTTRLDAMNMVRAVARQATCSNSQALERDHEDCRVPVQNQESRHRLHTGLGIRSRGIRGYQLCRTRQTVGVRLQE